MLVGLRLTMLLTAVTVSTAPQAQVYKWVDEDGRVTYQSTPPPENATSSETVEIRDATNTEAGKARVDEMINKSKQQLEQRAEVEEKAAQDATIKAERQANCQRARSELQRTKTATRIFTTDAEGNRVRQGEAEREAEIERLREAVAENCD